MYCVVAEFPLPSECSQVRGQKNSYEEQGRPGICRTGCVWREGVKVAAGAGEGGCRS